MPETAVVTILFCDLVGSTELLQSLGDDANDEVRRSLLDALGRAADAYGGTVVKSAGDGMMVSFRTSAADAVACGVAMQRAAANVEHAGAPLGLELRVGISSGEASHEHDDWFGTPVVEAARLEVAARPGQILVSDVVRTIVGTRGGAQFRDAGKREFKGFPRPVPVVEVVWRTADDPPPRPRRKTRKRRTRMLLAAAALASAVAVAGTIAALVLRDSGPAEDVVASGLPLVAEGYSPVLEPEPCDPEWIKGADVICEALIVPENREKPEGPKVRITVATFPSRGASANPPTVTIGGFEDNFEESDVRQYGDIISFDLRGNLPCPEVSSTQRQLVSLPKGRDADVVLQKAIRECGERLEREGYDLDQYGLHDMVTDLRDLAILKGWTQMNLQANGEWSRIATLFAQRYPQIVRAVVITDPLPIGAQENDMILNVNGAFEAYVAACRADEGCSRAFPELAELPVRLYVRLEAEPAIILVPDPDAGPDLNVYVDGDAAMFALAYALHFERGNSIIASTLAAEEGAMLRTTAYALVDFMQSDPELPWGVWYSEYCEDIDPLVSRTSIEASASAYPIFRGIVGDLDICANWPTMPDSPLEGEIKVAPVPALILAGEFSPWFPPAYADKAAEAFARPTVLSVPHLSSAVLSSGPQCISDLRLAFLRDPSSELDAEPCILSIPPIKFEGT